MKPSKGEPENQPQIGWRLFWSIVGIAALALLSVQAYYGWATAPPFDLSLLGQSDWTPDSRAALHLRLTDGAGRAPVPSSPIEVTLREAKTQQEVRLASIVTNADGSAAPQFQVPAWPEGDYELQVTATTNRGQETISQHVKLRNPWQLSVSTDKPIYQPGQVIRIRGLALRRPDRKPGGGQEMAFAVIDPKGNVVFRDRVPASSFGIAATDCPLAQELIEGTYQVECGVGDTTSQAAVEVKTYVLPRLRLTLDLDQPYYRPGSLARGTVQADYVFGKPVQDTAVLVTLESAELPAIAQIELKTDEQGRAGFEVRLPQSLTHQQQENDTSLHFRVSVRDSAGQAQALAQSRPLTARPIRIEVVPECGELVRGVSNTVYLLTSTPDGRPVQTRLSITGIERTLTTDELGVTSLEVTPTESPISWLIKAVDDQGVEGRREIVLPTGERSDDYLVRLERVVLRDGEPLKIAIIGSGTKPVFADLIKDGQTVHSSVIGMQSGRGNLELDLPDDLSGTVQLCTYQYGNDKLPVRKSRVIQIVPRGSLRIQTALDRDEYRPGGRAHLSLSITDSQGQPKPGAVSLVAVDEAVFALLDRRRGKELSSLDGELLAQVLQKHQWSVPTPDSDVDRNQFEQALFALTATRAQSSEDELIAALGPHASEIRSSLSVLNRPDWQELAAGSDLPASLIDQIRRGNRFHTLSATTYPDKVRQLEATRRSVQSTLGVGWALVSVTAVLGGMVWLFVHAQYFAEVVVFLVIAVVLVGLMLPAVQMAREASRRSEAMNDLRQIGMAASAGNLGANGNAAGATPATRVRQWFPETLLWRPELITDDQGRAELSIDLADSITNWRLAIDAVSVEGVLGNSEAGIRVFQPFFIDLDLPVALTRGDEVSVPVVVSNFLDRPQSVVIRLDDAAWLERLEEPEKRLELAAGEVRAAHFRIRATKIGRQQQLQVSAEGDGVSDAVRRTIEVRPEGRRVEQVTNGSLQEAAQIELAVPEEAIEGSVQAFVKFYPSNLSQLVEGLDSIFEMPHGCFEQTSSTTYPNVLALDYLQRTKQAVPEVETKAHQFIHLGYQRLLSFEISGGGFDWFGRSPANRTLTAYGLMEFQDMARVHEVDPKLIKRTRDWLLDQRRSDGSWAAEGHQLHEDPTAGPLADLSTTAYIAWAVFAGQEQDSKARPTREYLHSHVPQSITDPYTLALVCNALLAMKRPSEATSYLDRLVALRKTSDDGKQAWWDANSAGRTLFHGGGQSRRVETTAMAALALLRGHGNPETIRGALAWLVAQKDGRGTWHSTQATVLALKALLGGTERPLGGDKPRRLEVKLDGERVELVEIPAAQADVVYQLDISHYIGNASRQLTLEDRSAAGSGYQVVVRYHTPEQVGGDQSGPLGIRLDFDQTKVKVGDLVNVSASIMNSRSAAVPMVVVELPIAPGFTPVSEGMDAWVKSGIVSKWQRDGDQIHVYLRDLESTKPLTLHYQLRATMPVKASVPAARVFAYYEPEVEAKFYSGALTVEEN